MNKGKVIGVSGNMITVEIEDKVSMNEVGYIISGGKRLKAEVIRIQESSAQMQIFEISRGILVGDPVEFTGELLAVELGPGLLGQVYDGLQNPLPELAESAGFFLERGFYLSPLDREKKWEFKPSVSVGDSVVKADTLGVVMEGVFEHKIMVPFYLLDNYSVKSIVSAGEYTIDDEIAEIVDEAGNSISVKMSFTWPVKRAIDCYKERKKPVETLTTKTRLIDTFLPIAVGGTFCIPGPFGAGKTVLQQSMSKYADVDIVIVAACGERAGEVVETLKEFPELQDPKTGKSLMERTIIICNTSSMPVASREASVYTAVTLAEYYRQMGLNILLLADSTSRWAQAMREMSGRLEEIPGEEAFPAYLESTIASFYERAGLVELKDGSTGSVTIGGTVSPAGGNFEEPVTQATLKVVGAFLGLSRERSDARKYPAIHPMDSWSKYSGVINSEATDFAYNIMRRGNEIEQMMKVVGEEGTSIDDFIIYMMGEYIDSVYFQQNSFDEVDASVPIERQEFMFSFIMKVITSKFNFENKKDVRDWFALLRLKTLDLNGAYWNSDEFNSLYSELSEILDKKQIGLIEGGENLLKKIEVK